MTERTFSNKAPRWAAGSAALLLVLFSVGYADTTYVSGPITRSTTWTRANSPYVVVGNVLVQDTVTLTIEPGVTVAFDSLKALTINGTIIARGTANDSIRFTSRRRPASPGDWSYLQFSDPSSDAQFDSVGNYVSGCILEYCAVEYGGAVASVMLKLVKAHPFISRVRVSQSSGWGIGGSDLSFAVRVTGCVVEDNRGGVFLYGGRPDISGCHIARNDCGNDCGAGIFLNGGIASITDCHVAHNHAQYNGGGIWLYQCGFASVSRCSIVGNSAGQSGGGLYAVCDSVAVTDNWICDNTADYHGWYDAGGGIHVSGKTYIGNNVIAENGATNGWGGGGIACHSGSGRITGNVIRANWAGDATGVRINYYSSIRLDRNAITHNYLYGANYGGGVRVVDNSYGLLRENIICDNNAPTSVGGGVDVSSPADLTLNTVARNTAQNRGGLSYGGSDGYACRNNTITGNVSVDQRTPAVGFDVHANFNYNNLFGNDATYELRNNTAQGSADLDCEDNWWGTRVEAEIQQKIYDWYDDASLGIVDYSPWDTVIRTDCPVSPPTGVQAQAIGDTLVLVTWNANPEPDLEGYIVHWDTTNDTLYPFAHHVDVGRTTTYAVRGLTPDTYFVTVTAYDVDYDSTHNLSNTVINECQTEGNESWYAEGVYVRVAGIAEGGVCVLPREVELARPAPNPFSRTTRIGYALPAPAPVRLAVFDLAGREVARLVDGERPAGRHQARLDASALANGIYFCRLRAAGETRTAKLVVQR
jgi:hypothetical protein